MTYEETFKKERRPHKETLDAIFKQSRSKYPLFSLGVGEAEALVSEEDRESHMHIIGTTGEGKSYLLRHLIRHDIKRLKQAEAKKQKAPGVCLLDPSASGDNIRDILKYCAKIDFKKVCLIDPHHLLSHNVVCGINQFHYDFSYKDASVANIMDTILTVFGSKDAAETPRINKYLPSVLRILWASKAAISDAKYFVEKRYIHQREHLFNNLDPLDQDIDLIQNVYETRLTYENFQSTVNRLYPVFNSTLSLMFGVREGVNFAKLVSEGWLILVNLSDGAGFEPLHTRFLATTIINEIDFAIYRLRNRGFTVPYYLYIDEAGEYATRKIARILELKRQMGLRLILSHQHMSQFEDRRIQTSVQTMTKIKVGFYIPDPDERLKVVKMLGYGGDLSERDVNYALSTQQKQTAVIKLPKQTPAKVRIPDLPQVDVSNKDLDRFIRELYLNPWYYTPKQVYEQHNDRFKYLQPEPASSSQPPRKAVPPNRKADSKASAPKPTAFDRAAKEGVRPKHKNARKDGEGQTD